ncbi:TlpA family protein disulfide reductase [Mucilaginibacter sp. ZT4R22]|uniref:TlpA family protein disulfide reductase n=1 Tax=Mucilaginibacter pankratovii TaxID=2772110 RepID=A0ABR7WYU5_9SPHI|nr:TlpA disulfide reductase family protein [Mucilaginibacter pankratovii]MBD1367465.1 TlpA family protein disulfide reductase [Mucilaginibacter pankratovii]
MKKLILLLMAAFVVAIAFGKPQEMGTVIITGKVINVSPATPKVVKFNFCNPLIPGGKSVQLNHRDEFVVSEHMLYTQNMTVHYLNNFINLYVQPGDSIHLTIDAALLDKPNFAWLRISGDHAVFSTQLNSCVDYLYKLPVHHNNPALEPAAMLVAVQQDYQRYVRKIDQYAVEHQLSKAVVNWAKRDVKYLIANDIGDYGNTGKYRLPAERIARIQFYTESFFDIYDPANFQSMMFPYHLSNYIYYKIRTDSTIDQAAKQGRIAEAEQRAVRIILKEPAGECRDYMLYNHLAGTVSQFPGILDSLANAGQWFTKAVYYDALKSLSEKITKPSFPPTKINGVNYLDQNKVIDLPPTDIFTHFRSKYPGKVVYVDIYATWCGPCLEEMKSTPALYRAMQGKDIVFVNLCLQSTEIKWQALVKEKHLEGENYFFSDDATKLFMGTYRLSGYPSFILINKQGQIITTNAPRPSDRASITKAITQLLQEK